MFFVLIIPDKSITNCRMLFSMELLSRSQRIYVALLRALLCLVLSLSMSSFYFVFDAVVVRLYTMHVRQYNLTRRRRV